MVIPRLRKDRALLSRLSNDLAKFASRIAQVHRDADLAQPDLRFLATLDDMNMRRLPAVGGVEEKAITLPAQQCRHDYPLNPPASVGMSSGLKP